MAEIYNTLTVSATTGGTISLPLNTSHNYFIIQGTTTLSSGLNIIPDGTFTPQDGTVFNIKWQAVVTSSYTNTVTIFGKVLTISETVTNLFIRCYYQVSAWVVDVVQIYEDESPKLIGSSGFMINGQAIPAFTPPTVPGTDDIDTAGSKVWLRKVNDYQIEITGFVIFDNYTPNSAVVHINQIFTAPTGYRPSADRFAPVSVANTDSDEGYSAILKAVNTGEVYVYLYTGNITTATSDDNVYFTINAVITL